MTIESRAMLDDDEALVSDDQGRRVPPLALEQHRRLARRFYEVADGVWCLVGNGLSNQTFVGGPEGIIAIDTGESVQEMAAALVELRRVTDEPIVEVLYTHFHYVSGTRAILDQGPVRAVRGHPGIADNLARAAAEIGPAYARGLVAQFGVSLPASGPDSLLDVGLGLFFRNPDHAPFTPGHEPVTDPVADGETMRVAGLEVQAFYAPSDADDSVTYWIPSLGVAVNNLVWPALFNVFAIRGESYRDPQVLLPGLDRLLELEPSHLVGTHGPPLSGRAEIAHRVRAYRDAIQYLWDQTVRWTNRGASSRDLPHLVSAPEEWSQDYLTRQSYGLVEHHVRQIRSGLFGFFGGEVDELLPLAPVDRAERMVEAMGGPEAVRGRVREALGSELRWAIELAGYLAARTEADEDDRRLLAEALRVVARRTSSANLRNWCLTRAGELDGSIDLSRFRRHRIGPAQVRAWPIETAVGMVRVMVDPEVLDRAEHHVAVVIDGRRAGLHFRNRIACPTDGVDPDSTLECSAATWATLLSGRDLSEVLAAGEATVSGDRAGLEVAWRSVDPG